MNSVCPVLGANLSLSSAGRTLLSVPHIAFGDPSSGGLSNELPEPPTVFDTDDPAGAGSCVVILGPNGAGKSLLLKTLCALQKSDTGEVLWAGSPPDKQRRHQVGLMLQKPILLRRSALANLSYALGLRGHTRAQSKQLSLTALEGAGLSNIAASNAQQLSGGEQQRLALLRALLLRPHILFLDEATANVDPSSTFAIEQQLINAKHNGLNIVMVSHDIAQAKRLADEVILMHKGEVIERCACGQFFDAPTQTLTQRWVAGELLV